MTDNEICDHCLSEEASKPEDEEEEEEESCPVTHSMAARMFDQCLTWLEKQPEADYQNVAMLKELRSLAARKRVSSLQQRTLKDILPTL